MALETYFDFAENDYLYFKISYDNGIVANAMAANAQGICEKYIKHIISTFYFPKSSADAAEMEKNMRTHNLTRLLKYLKNSVGISFSEAAETAMKVIDGYYFSARYPGEDSITIDQSDLDSCMKAIECCRTETAEIMNRLVQTNDEE